MSRIIGFIFGLLFTAAALSAWADTCGSVKADKVLVLKSERKLYLLKDEKVLKIYTVSLGSQPVGTKRQKGDKKTPEGHYILDHRNAKSKYYKSIRISYPNEADRRQAARRGVDPGGHIMIHGLPTSSENEAWHYIERDWTDGCVAVTNKEMQEVWELVEDNTPIEIRP